LQSKEALMTRLHTGLLAISVALALAGGAGGARGQAVTDEWSSVKLPDAPEVKPVTIDPKTTALIVMDFNKAGCSQERRPRCVTALPHVAELLKSARAHNLFVLHTLAGTTTVADIPDSVKPIGSEQAFKAGPDKFINSDLDKILKEKGITTVMLVGTAANGAELHTASGAAMRGYKVIVPVDGMPGDSPFTEAYSIWHMTHAPASAGNIALTKTDMVKF
jgi:nicotinamidase-related amidase